MASRLEVVVFGVPVSLQGGRRGLQAWKEQVSRDARAQIAEEGRLIETDLRVRIVYFHVDTCEPDVDNIVKPILDGVSAIAFGDDRQVAELAVRRTQLEGFSATSPSPTLAAALERALGEGLEFVYLLVTDDEVDHQVFS